MPMLMHGYGFSVDIGFTRTSEYGENIHALFVARI